MYRVDRNNYYQNQKRNVVYTPAAATKFLFSILDGKINKKGIVLDPCVGRGDLLFPFINAGYRTIGVDTDHQGFHNTIVQSFLDIKKDELETPSLIIMNPPFNINEKTGQYIKAHYGRRPLLPEVWLMKVIELFGTTIPTVMFTPHGFRLNQSFRSKRWKKFEHGTYPEIVSIVSLPKDIFHNIQFHAEVLLFNIEGLKGHYFCREEVSQ